MKKLLSVFFVGFLAFSCQYESISIDEGDHSIAGSWLYVEYGYSPGDEYHTVPVPAEPPKTITFGEDFTMSSTDIGLERYKYYRLLKDSVRGSQVIAFFQEDPANEPLDLANLVHAYNAFLKGNTLNLNYRWCVEGCHMKFRRISSPDL